MKLEIKCDDIDEYIAAFENLIIRAGWECGAKGSLDVFKGIHYTISQRDPIPQSLDDWQTAARCKVER